jgi:hypothetical protein
VWLASARAAARRRHMLLSGADLVQACSEVRAGAEQLEWACPQLVLAMAAAALGTPSAWPDLAGECALASVRSPPAAGQLQVVGQGGVVGQRLGRGAPAARAGVGRRSGAGVCRGAGRGGCAGVRAVAEGGRPAAGSGPGRCGWPAPGPRRAGCTCCCRAPTWCRRVRRCGPAPSSWSGRARNWCWPWRPPRWARRRPGRIWPVSARWRALGRRRRPASCR